MTLLFLQLSTFIWHQVNRKSFAGMDQGLEHFPVESGVSLGITVDNEGIGLELLAEDCKLHVVSHYYGSVEGVLEDLCIGDTP